MRSSRRRIARVSDPTLEKDHEKKNAEKIFLHFDTAAIDRIFTNSTHLSSVRDSLSFVCGHVSV